MKIKQTDLARLIKEELSLFYVTPDAFAKQKNLDNTSTKPLQERKFVVNLADIGNVVVSGGSEGEIRTRLSKKLRAGKKDIISIAPVAKGKADMAAKKLGIEDSENRGIEEANPTNVKTGLFNNRRKTANQLVKKLQGQLNIIDNQFRQRPNEKKVGLMLALNSINRHLQEAIDSAISQINK